MTPTALTVNCVLPLTKSGRGGRTVRRSSVHPNPTSVDPDAGKVPRVARLMALAIHFDGLLRQGLARDQADLARLGQVTQARMSQVMSLLNLAPDIQEELLFLPPVTKGRPDVILADLLPVAKEWEWGRQRSMWKRLSKR
jgi:hypothetical protein